MLILVCCVILRWIILYMDFLVNKLFLKIVLSKISKVFALFVVKGFFWIRLVKNVFLFLSNKLFWIVKFILKIWLVLNVSLDFLLRKTSVRLFLLRLKIVWIIWMKILSFVMSVKKVINYPLIKKIVWKLFLKKKTVFNIHNFNVNLAPKILFLIWIFIKIF